MERQKGGFIRWGIALTGDGALIGGIYLYRNDGKVFLGYLLHPAYWGNGYAFEAVSLVTLCFYGMEHKGIARLCR